MQIQELAAWLLLLLGIGHTGLGIFRYRRPFSAAFTEGVFNRFKVSEQRALAFWFTIFGLMMAIIGHLSLYAVHVADTSLLRLIGVYVLIVGVAGAVALPKSPFWFAILISIVFMFGGAGSASAQV